MGRDGIAYTFVTTEEGGELTRIEILINRLLKRDEIEGFSAVATTARTAMSASPDADSDEGDEPAEPQEPQPPKPRPPGRRPVKRHRKGL
jgi:ATP-dependent RNA helicase DeaD